MKSTVSENVQTLQEIDFNLKQLAPYVMNITDMETTKFKQAKKRVLFNSLSMELLLRT